MKRYRIWRKLLVLTLVLAFGLTASLQASEDVSEDTAGTEEEIVIEDAETENVTTGMYAAPVDDDPESEDEVLTIDNVTQVPTTSVPEAISEGSGAEDTTSVPAEISEDPGAEAGSLESIRIEAGAGTSFRSGTLHASKHVEEGDSFTLNLFYTPVRADIRNITWSVAVCNDATPQVIFGSAKAAETVTVRAGEETDVKDKGIHAKAEGSRLTITSTDDQEHVIIVSATAESAEGQKFDSPAEAMLSFVHSWDEVKVTEATCVDKGSVEYHCTTCGKEKTVDIPALEHVYNKNGDLNKGDGKDYTVKVVEEPTCTEEGLNEYTYYCLRCGDAETETGKRVETAPVPALGHAWSEAVKAPASCNKDTETITCTRCGMKRVSLVPAYNPELHVWKETYRYHETCMSDTVYEQCEVCRETRMRKETADNPDRHSYAYESRVVNDCNWSTYTFKCVHGCGTTEVKLKKEDNHNWSDWTVTTKWDKTTGMTTRTQVRKCSRCGYEETKNLGSVVTSTAEESVVSAGNNAVAAQPVSYSAGNAVAAAVAQAAPSTATASEEKTGWQKSGKKKYYLDEDGKKQTGWQKIDGKKYYFGKDGTMKIGWQTIKGKKYYFGKDGVMRTGKQKIGKKTYNFGKNGVLK